MSRLQLRAICLMLRVPAFMTCKINGVDDDVLMKSQKCDGDMFLLSRVGNYPYNEACMTEIGKLPQKLAWNMKVLKS